MLNLVLLYIKAEKPVICSIYKREFQIRNQFVIDLKSNLQGQFRLFRKYSGHFCHLLFIESYDTMQFLCLYPDMNFIDFWFDQSSKIKANGDQIIQIQWCDKPRKFSLNRWWPDPSWQSFE